MYFITKKSLQQVLNLVGIIIAILIVLSLLSWAVGIFFTAFSWAKSVIHP